ncbi:hypothetical protein Nepgr_002771 [Nepenthes gracilis]|uniref:BRCT domain-containing protein n=1 Tax=Nepenthes gracilis TaxID=150966 RepID=A0AAD3RX85_NEPGR|nr:hypothetical protein Nepgr_002771 [Nepenthes gracilis]
MMSTKPFKGSSVFMSRNLVPPEVFDTLHDALKQNGAEVFLCCDPSRNGSNDYHIISSSDHEKFGDLRDKGCNLLGPQCVLSCAKERRALPKQGFTCCLAMDGVKVLVSGFEAEERGKLGKLVIAMGGRLHSKASLDVSFVIVKSVRAAKYKWALHVQKPVVTISWLYQCWNEHRVVPQESYRVPAFLGLIICVSRIPADERKEMEKVVVQNGGKYSAELTKTSPEGDKYKVARKWGHISIVTRKWFDQSIARRACLIEEAYPVLKNSESSSNTVKGLVMAKHSQKRSTGNSLSIAQLVVPDSKLEAVPSFGIGDSDLEATLSQNFSSAFSDASVFVGEEEDAPPAGPSKTDSLPDCCVAKDSQTEDNDLYLSDCRISLVGFGASDMRKLVNMVRRGGGSRFVSYSERLTHIVVGAPSDEEKKDLRGLAALGVIHFVRAIWLEDCDREKREMPVMQRHIAYDILLPKDLIGSFNNGSAIGMTSMTQGKSSTIPSCISTDISLEALSSEKGTHFKNDRDSKFGAKVNGGCFLEGTGRSSGHCLISAANGEKLSQKKIPHDGSLDNAQNEMSSGVFTGRCFRFSNSFPEDRRDEVVQWINQGGGEVVDSQLKENGDFIVECHGVKPWSSGVAQTACVSTHWIRSCLEDGRLHDVGSHILYSPLTCRIPLFGFNRLRFCVSQYEEKDRLLLRNLCFVLGAKFGEKLTKKVTHLLCKFASGTKYEAACKWGIQPVTCEWVYECVVKNEVVPLNPFYPKEVSAQDQEAGLCIVTQYPTPAVRMVHKDRDNSSQFSSQSRDSGTLLTQTTVRRVNSEGEGTEHLNYSNKKARLFEHERPMDATFQCPNSDKNFPNNTNSTGDSIHGNAEEKSAGVLDVAAAIEDLLEQTSKVYDQKSTGETESKKTMFSSDCQILGTDHSDCHSAFGLSQHWLRRAEKKDDPQQPLGDQNAGVLDGFSETQTESQLVGYEEDLSGRQMIIDRVRTRKHLTSDERHTAGSFPIIAANKCCAHVPCLLRLYHL